MNNPLWKPSIVRKGVNNKGRFWTPLFYSPWLVDTGMAEERRALQHAMGDIVNSAREQARNAAQWLAARQAEADALLADLRRRGLVQAGQTWTQAMQALDQARQRLLQQNLAAPMAIVVAQGGGAAAQFFSPATRSNTVQDVVRLLNAVAMVRDGTAPFDYGNGTVHPFSRCDIGVSPRDLEGGEFPENAQGGEQEVKLYISDRRPCTWEVGQYATRPTAARVRDLSNPGESHYVFTISTLADTGVDSLKRRRRHNRRRPRRQASIRSAFRVLAPHYGPAH